MQVVFGTDGVRDVANTKLTPEIAFIIGRIGVGKILSKSSNFKAKVVIGMDTRISSPMLEAAISSGIASLGVDVLCAKYIPTPAVARLAVELGCDLGVVISASHNPFEYNGIKFFDGEGFKLSDSIEREIEEEIKEFQATGKDVYPRLSGDKVGRIIELDDAIKRYTQYVVDSVDTDLLGLHIVLDCANGAASFTSREILEKLGAKVTEICASPNGVNINDKCGSTYPDMLCETVKKVAADFGIAHDGDADRVITCDHLGNIVDGDDMMAICAKAYKHKAIVATNYSNLGLKKAMDSISCEVVLAENGDRYVLEEMKKRGITLGGEKSGHIIFLDCSTTGDGILTGVKLAKAIVDTGKSLNEMASDIKHFPQVLKNVYVEDKNAYGRSKLLEEAILKAEAEIGEYGRVYIRASGTEPVIRVMVEAEDLAMVEDIADRLAELISIESLKN